MKVFLFSEQSTGDKMYGVFEVSDVIKQIPQPEASFAVFGSLCQQTPLWATTRVRCPFLVEEGKGGFFWHTLDEHQGAHEFFPVLFGDWSEAELEAIGGKWGEDEWAIKPLWFSPGSEELEMAHPDLDMYSPEAHVLSANTLLSNLKLKEATEADFKEEE